MVVGCRPAARRAGRPGRAVGGASRRRQRDRGRRRPRRHRRDAGDGARCGADAGRCRGGRRGSAHLGPRCAGGRRLRVLAVQPLRRTHARGALGQRPARADCRGRQRARRRRGVGPGALLLVGAVGSDGAVRRPPSRGRPCRVAGGRRTLGRLLARRRPPRRGNDRRPAARPGAGASADAARRVGRRRRARRPGRGRQVGRDGVYGRRRRPPSRPCRDRTACVRPCVAGLPT